MINRKCSISENGALANA